MPKKNNDNKSSAILLGIVESLKGLVVESVKSGMYNLLDTLREYTERLQKRIMLRFAYYFLLAISVIFISIALINLLEQYLELTPGWSYLIIGVALLIFALATKYRMKDI